jgi:hypothetical protein
MKRMLKSSNIKIRSKKPAQTLKMNNMQLVNVRQS